MTVLREVRTSSAADATGNVLRLQSLATGAKKLFLVSVQVCAFHVRYACRSVH